MPTMDSPPSEVSPDNDNARTGHNGHHKKRVRVWTEDDRAKHRVFEKSRREAFSDSLLSLARFLPSLATVKESKLSKHTIVDESLKYHEVQQAKLNELQNSIDVLKTEKETLLAEISHWRRCLDTPPQQAPGTAPCELPATHEPIPYGSIGNQAVEYSGLDSSLETTYSGPLVSEPGVNLDLPAAPTTSAMPSESFTGTSLQIQQIDPYPLQQTTVPFSGAPMQDFSLLHPQDPAHTSSYHQPPLDTTTWIPQRPQQAYHDFLTYQSYGSLPLDTQRNQF